MLDRTLSIAPMLDCTDRHCRYFLRLLSPHALLYTEMVTCGAIIHGDKEQHLGFSAEEHPLALQLGGSDPQQLAECAHIAEDYGYDEVNLNIGCPSDRVQSGRFGACLMAEPDLVAECVAAMQARVSIPVTVKTRIGIDEQDSYELLHRFVSTVAAAGCDVFIIHARKAWLQGLSPKQNREIPPLRYEVVYHLKQDFPHLHFSINGGIKTLADVQTHLAHVDGVMIGREAYHNSYMLTELERVLFSTIDIPTREAVVAEMLPYLQRHTEQGQRLHHAVRHMIGLYLGQPNARLWRRYLSEHGCKHDAGVEVVTEALKLVRDNGSRSS